MLETRHGDSISTSTTKVASPAPELFIGLKGISRRASSSTDPPTLSTSSRLAFNSQGLKKAGNFPFPEEVSFLNSFSKNSPLALSTLNMKVIGPSGKVDGNSSQLQEKLGNSTTSAKTGQNSRILPSKNLNSSRNLPITGHLGRVRTKSLPFPRTTT